MSGVHQTIVGKDEAEQRLDRWFKRRYPTLTHGRLEKLLRTGQIRVDGARAKANTRLEVGQTIRIPPLGDAAAKKKADAMGNVSDKDAAMIRSIVIYKDSDMLPSTSLQAWPFRVAPKPRAMWMGCSMP